MKRIICSITALAILASCLFSFSMTANAEESIKFSEEYKGSPYYTKLTAALEDSKDKTTMGKGFGGRSFPGGLPELLHGWN